MRSLLTVPAALLVLTSLGARQAAQAQQDPYRMGLLSMRSGEPVWVFRDKDAMGQATELLNSGVAMKRPDSLWPLIACTVQDRTPVVIADKGFWTDDIMVTDGPETGCRGNVPANWVRISVPPK